jgi:hypothetical protein
MQGQTIYFDEPGIACTEETVRLAVARAKELGVARMTLASTGGHTARVTLKALAGTNIKIFVLGHERNDFPADLLAEMEAAGHRAAFDSEYSYDYPEIVANAYRKFGEGIKVAVECAAVATDQGFVAVGEEVVSIGGTGPWGYEEKGGGADTALVVEGHPISEHLKDAVLPGKADRRRVKELICKPR